MSSKAWDKAKEGRQEITNQVIEMMKDKNTNWIQPWVDSYTRPYNPVSNSTYHGANVLRLWITSQEKKYEDPRWVTFKQAANNGWQIIPGEKGTLLEYWNRITKEVENPKTGEKKQETIPILNTFYVYNAQQIQGIPELETTAITQKFNGEYNVLADQLIASSECQIKEDKQSSRAYYTPYTDSITLPDRSQFYETAGFVETLLHEMGHSTGHPSRLNRDSIAAMTKPTAEPITTKDENNINSYPLEELVAEFTSIMVEKDLGVQSSGSMKNHAAYLNSWILELQNDPNALFRAIAAADKASERILENYNQLVTREAQEKLSIESFVPQETFEEFCKEYKFVIPSSDEMQEIYHALENPHAALDPQKYYRVEKAMKISKAYAENIENGKILGRMKNKEVNPTDKKMVNQLIDQNIKARNFDTVSALYNLRDHGTYATTDETPIHMSLRHSYDDLKEAGSNKEKAMDVYQYAFNFLKPEMIPALHQLVQQRPDTTLETYIDLAISQSPKLIKDYIKNGTYELDQDKQALADFLNNREGDRTQQTNTEDHSCTKTHSYAVDDGDVVM